MTRRQATERILTAVAILGIVGGLVYWWWPHLVWKVGLERNQVDIPAVPVSPLKAPGHTQGWPTCRVGPLTLKLPAKFMERADREAGKNTIELKLPKDELSIFIPVRLPAEEQQGLVPLAKELDTPLVQMIADSYRESTSDFSWWMSRKALRRHQLLMGLGFSMFPHSAAMWVETRFDSDLEGLLVAATMYQAHFNWRSTSGESSGVLLFTRKDDPLDMDEVRDICQSLTVDETDLPKEYSKKDLKRILDDIVVTPAKSIESE